MELFGISIVTLVLGLLAGAWMALKWAAPKTSVEWDDSIVDVIEGACATMGMDPDELAEKSLGRLKSRIVKK
jgi:hypothetical protein